MNPAEKFAEDCRAEVVRQAQDVEFQALTRSWLAKANSLRYSYHFAALGRPIIQYPQDMVALQELIWNVKPDLIIETGIAHGGSLVLSASMLALLDWCEAAEAETKVDPRASKRRVVGVDIEIRPHNREAIYAHPMSALITMIEGSSIAEEVVNQVRQIATEHQSVLVFLDSNHTHEHVLAELKAYAPLVSPGSYCVVFDTVIEDLGDVEWTARDWGPGNNPKTAVWQYLQTLESGRVSALDGAPLRLEIDSTVENKIAVTVAPDGFLRRVP